MKKSIGLLFATALAAGLVAGCNNNSSNNNNGFGTNCGGPPAGFQIIYPQNNAPRVPAVNANTIFVAANPALVVGNSYNFSVVQSNGNQQFSGPFTKITGSVQIPKPHNSPAPGSTLYFTNLGSPIGPLQGVNLFWNDGGTGCTPNVIVSAFTTGQ
jgi:hypothetical protein